MKLKWYIFLIIIGYIVYRYIYDGTEHIVSTIDGKSYKVRKGVDSLKKANFLAMLRLKFSIIVEALNKDPKYQYDPVVQRLINKWNSGLTLKEIGQLESDAAYVFNKKHMSFCLQDLPGPGQRTKTNTIEDTNLITYVGIHELAHVMSNETGHGAEFIKNFEFLLNYSKGLNWHDPILDQDLPIYIPLNELNTTDNYCGVPLHNSIN